MPDYWIKANDRAPSIQATLSVGGTPVDLSASGTAVKFIMAPSPGGTPTVNATAVIVDATHGIVRYDWAAGDTVKPGNYEAEWQITWSDGREQTFPTLGYHAIDIVADLNGS